jgi:thiol-disulfide isomerase/thioredoxin
VTPQSNSFSKSKLFGITVLLAVVLLTVYSVRSKQEGRVDVYANLQKIKGFDLNEVKGQYFVLHYWAKWCEPCAEEIPHLIEFAKKAHFQKPFKVLAVSLDSNLDISKSILPNQGKDLPTNFVLVLDADHSSAEGLGSYQYPETYFVDPTGQVIEKWVGPQKWNKPEVLEFFKDKVL